MKVAAVSLGCPKNRVDTETMLGLLREAGFSPTLDLSSAQVILVNTCAFIEPAQREAVVTILELAQQKKKGQVLLVTGCLVELFGSSLLEEMPEIDGLIGTGALDRVVSAVGEALEGRRPVYLAPPGFLGNGTPRLLSTPSYYAYLKIAEGCSHRCSFCRIPYLRGPYRSRPPEEILREAAELAERGVKELILVAQDTTSWGIDLYGRPSLALLLRELAALEKVKWIRILYAHPASITDELLEVMAKEDKICRYLDLPLQHLSPRILKRMGRPLIDPHRLVQRIRKALPGVVLRTTFIVGFPGEEKEDFALLLRGVRELGFERIGIFPYYREEGTPAASLPEQVPEEEKRRRYRRLAFLARKLSRWRLRRLVGKEITVLVEGEKGKFYRGRSEGDAPEIDGWVYLRTDKPLQPGDFVHARVTKARTYDLEAEVLERG
ncbi:MiaB-like tRNA modifying enzyme YliG [Ammonifex degensii KC4]|uniref:Ribosomal protein uS12 methylthiotransferase RimO n=1 Tax=Ammonifex degensii (strain DSM 10501 / KC4) TaxID=429009 RepID=C9R9P2_AMMDK|nr:30S ribosomal protein S12 methylthiotransferase RimO [Ammonifex degensii]ACX53021.1 MiaB-like tRNA modifying enzyme YliG [Ammonifex degensii KC4]